jgi:hypothetical protein
LLPDGGSAQADKGALHYVEVRGKGKHWWCYIVIQIL